MSNKLNNLNNLNKILSNQLKDHLVFIKKTPKNILILNSLSNISCLSLESSLQNIFPESIIQSIEFNINLDLDLDLNNLTFDMIYIPLLNLNLDKLDLLFSKLNSKLNPNGLFCFNSLGPDTQFDYLDIDLDIKNFYDMHHFGDALLNNQFIDPVVDVDRSNQNLELIFGLGWKQSIQNQSKQPLKQGRARISLEALKAQLKQQGYQDLEGSE